ncbi:MCP four helix bundle domain-containing protein [Polyangium aurulentum]|nr:MCP four helix bundle domain-containing protein [Polyangium aurulentum]
MVLVAMVVSAAGWWYIRGLSRHIEALSTENLQGATYLSNAERGLWELRFALPNYALSEGMTREQITASHKPLIDQVNRNMAAFSALPVSDEERSLLAEWNRAFGDYLRSRPRYFQLLDEGKTEEAVVYRSTKTNPPAAAAVRVLASLIEAQRARGSARAQQAEGEAAAATRATLGLAGAALVLGFLLSRAISGLVATQVSFAMRVVESSSSELEASAAKQLGGARELTAATSTVSESLRELLGSARHIDEAARNVAAMAEETRQSAKSGDLLIKRAQEGLAGMRSKVEDSARRISELGDKSQQIGSILALINELSEQTNILAINAAVEAAGAGDAGRRFGVVASEIRRLADRVGGSARQVRGIVEEIRTSAAGMVAATENGLKVADANARQVGEALKSFEAINEQVESTTIAAKEIEALTQAQTEAVEMAGEMMGNISLTAQITEASSQETLRTCEQLGQLSRRLGVFAGPEAPAVAQPPTTPAQA